MSECNVGLQEGLLVTVNPDDTVIVEEMKRKLASIQEIAKLEPIPGADAIEKATVLGWQVVVKKGDFKVGDLCVFCEIDSILPDKPEFEFLKARHFRIKTIRLRGVISQGIAFPMSVIPEPVKTQMSHASNTVLIGTDITRLMGIIKWEPNIPAQLAGKVKGRFPDFMHKTDEERVQSCPNVLERHKGKEFYLAEKVDGSSMTVYLRGLAFGVCSRNLEIVEDANNSFWKVARELDLENKLKSVQSKYGDLALQGELLGPGVQKNKYGLQKLTLKLFNIYNIKEGTYFPFDHFRAVAQELGLETVPFISESLILEHTVEQLVELSKGQSLLNKDVPREGIVLRPRVEAYDTELGRLSFKVINPLFLLKFDE